MFDRWMRTRPDGRPSRRQTPRRRRPAVEVLEGRALLTSANYTFAFGVPFGPQGTGTPLATDSSGNAYITGRFNGTPDFDPGPGTAVLTNHSSGDTFVAKYSSTGGYVWAKSLAGGFSSITGGTGIGVDSSGNVYVAGYFTGTIDLDPGAGTATMTSAGDTDIFVVKLDSSGNYVWGKRIGGASSDVATALAVEGSGNVYVGGSFDGTVDFDPNAGVSNLTGVNAGFVVKLNSSGNYVAGAAFASNGNAVTNSLAVDGSGNVYSTGFFYFASDFDPGAGVTTLTSAGNQDVFVLKLNSSLGLGWARSVGAVGIETANGVAVDGSGNVYTTGQFSSSSVDFDPGAGVATVTNPASGYYQAFVLKLNSSGNFVWVDQFGSTGDDGGAGIALDGSGNPYVTGYYSGTVDFDPGAGVTNLVSGTNGPIFTIRLTPAGALTWAIGGGSGGGGTSSIAVNSSGLIKIAGTHGVLPQTFGAYFADSTSNANLFLVGLNQTTPSPFAPQFSTSSDPAPVPDAAALVYAILTDEARRRRNLL